jgi:hypothetical protein
MRWPKRPRIYEINTWAWLHELGERCFRPVELSSVPERVWDELGTLGVDAVWFMGVWERSPAGREIAHAHAGLQAEFHRALPDYSLEDNVGSPYCVRRYVVDGRLGGPEGLAAAREALAKRGLRLLLDFVPNHVARDHSWVAAHPEYFIRGTAEDLAQAPAEFFARGDQVFACGRDPYFPPWTDVLQLDAFHPELRRAAVRTLRQIAGQCDGVRCDMAMLFIGRVFEGTWGRRAGAPPASEYWREVIGAVRAAHPDFLFLAEAYWELEWELMQQGFDFCYDKRLFDRLEHDTAEEIRLHLLAETCYQERLVRFLENHDEPRAAATFPGERGRAAGLTILTLPGAKLLHEGQIEGRQVRLPVQLGRRPAEPVDGELRAYYRRLLQAVDTAAIREGEWRLCETTGWPDNQSCRNLVAWCWRLAAERWVVVVNLSGGQGQGRVRIPWEDLNGKSWRLTDRLMSATYDRDGAEMHDPGLYVDLSPWGRHLFEVELCP